LSEWALPLPLPSLHWNTDHQRSRTRSRIHSQYNQHAMLIKCLLPQQPSFWIYFSPNGFYKKVFFKVRS